MAFSKKMIGAFWASIIAAALAVILLFCAELTPLPVYGCHTLHAICMQFIMLTLVSIAAEYLTTQSFEDLLLDLAISAGLAIMSVSCYPLKQDAHLSNKFGVLFVPGLIMAILAAFVGKSKRQQD